MLLDLVGGAQLTTILFISTFTSDNGKLQSRTVYFPYSGIQEKREPFYSNVGFQLDQVIKLSLSGFTL